VKGASSDDCATEAPSHLQRSFIAFQVTKPNQVDILLSSSPISVNMNDLGLNECVKAERGVHASK
jgi:hypothetical protein